MDARLFRAAVLLAAAGSLGASYRTENFLITAPTEELAQQIGHEAERFRRELALEWLGRELPRWSQPCPITATVGDELGAGGVTRFYFDRGPSGRVEPLGWQMAVQGSRERILDSVLPHEVMHTVFASHFRRPLPRWADEGACTVVEHASERAKQHQMLITFLKTGRGIPFDKMFAMKEYPPDMLPIYSQGYSATRFLIAHGGKRKFVQFMETGFRLNDWPAAVRQHYGYQDLGALQNTWLDWVRAGSPNQVDPSQEKETLLVDGSGRRARPEPNLIYREPRGIEDASAAAAVPIAPRGGSTSPHAAPAGEQASSLAMSDPAVRSASAAQPAPQAPTGWYARGRAPTPSPASSRTAVDEHRGIPDHRVSPQQLVRPQPIQQPGQIILEWSR